MTRKYEIENLLRPPYEMVSALSLGAASSLCLLAPSILSLPPQVALGIAGAMAGLGGYRAKQAYEVLRYHHDISTTPGYCISPELLETKKDGALFLGLGFDWRARHIERLIATFDSRNEKYTNASWISRWLAKSADLGGRPALHGVGRSEEKVCYLDAQARPGHLIVVGASGVGKSRKAELLITQDIHRGNNLVIVIDPKGDAGLLRRVYCEAKRAGRLNEFRCLHLAFPESSCKYNPVGSFARVTEVPSRLTGSLPDEGDAKSFKDFAWQFSGFISNALIRLGDKPTYRSVKKYFRRPDGLFIRYAINYLREKNIELDSAVRRLEKESVGTPRAIKERDSQAVTLWQVLKLQPEIEDTILLDLMYMIELDPDYYQKISIQLLPFLEKVTTGPVGEILSPSYEDPDDPRETLSLPDIFKQGGVVYVGLDALTDPETATAVGESLFSELTSLAGYMYNYGIDPENPWDVIPNRDCCIHGDEFTDLIGPRFINMINKTRGVGYYLNLYTQTVADSTVKLGSEARTKQLYGNIATLIMMRPHELETAELLANRLPQVKVRDHIMVSGYQDQADSGKFISNNQDRTTETRIPLVSAAEVMALPKGHAFVMSEGNRLRKIRFPMLVDPDEAIPNDIGEMINEMSARYSYSVDWAELTHGWKV